jgi:hypothetical protein
MSSNTENPGVITGHVKLVQGKAQELAGYTEAGQANIQAGTEEVCPSRLPQGKSVDDCRASVKARLEGVLTD